MSKPKANQPAIVITHFAKELGLMLSQYLTDPELATQNKSKVVVINQHGRLS